MRTTKLHPHQRAGNVDANGKKYVLGKTVRGATRRRRMSPDERKHFKWGRYLVFLICIASVAFGAQHVQWRKIYHKVYQSTNRPLANVRIESEFKYVSQLELEKLILKKLDGRFVDLDLGKVKTKIEENPWIESVVIERIWPDSLKFIINEQVPIARWKANGYFNRQGKLIKVSSNEVLAHLPLLSGDENQSDELARNYVMFTELLAASDLRVQSLTIDKKLSWTLQTEDFVLILGRGEIRQRLENFKFIYDSYLKINKSNIKQIDMRYEKGLAVEWQQVSQHVSVNTAK